MFLTGISGGGTWSFRGIGYGGCGHWHQHALGGSRVVGAIRVVRVAPVVGIVGVAERFGAGGAAIP